MKLARSVFSKGGMLLLPRGTVLAADQARALVRAGLGTIAVELTSDEPPPLAAEPVERPDDLMPTVRRMVSERFDSLPQGNPHIQALFNLAVERQGRLLLSCPGKVALGKVSSPAFQTPRPDKVEMSALVENSQRMGTLPIVFQRLVAALHNHDMDVHEVAKIIATDPALTAKLLRLVNSPFYGLPYKIDSIPRAVVMVGARQLSMLAMGATLVTVFKGLPVSLVNMQSFWSHSISTGAASRLLARQIGHTQPESFFVAGLLHDIGRLLLYSQLPKHSLYLLTEAKRRRVSVYSQEKETLGFSHDALGLELLDFWRCPPELTARVAGHHTLPGENDPPEAYVLPVANMMAQALGYGSSGEILLFPVPDRAWEQLGLSPEDLTTLCHKLDNSIRHLRSLFTPGKE
jgi:putative nucleotidyltransferase with HDIG domain